MPAERRPHPFVGLVFGESKTGRLARGAFARGVAQVLVGCGLAVALVNGLVWASEALIGDEPPSVAVTLVQVLGFLVAGVVATVAGLLTFGFFNLIAKRVRDLGFPGWKTVAVLTMLGTAFSFAAPLTATIGYIVAVWSVLLLVPTSERPYVYTEPQ